MDKHLEHHFFATGNSWIRKEYERKTLLSANVWKQVHVLEHVLDETATHGNYFSFFLLV